MKRTCGQCQAEFTSQKALYAHKKEAGHLNPQPGKKPIEVEVRVVDACTCFRGAACEQHEGASG